MRKELIELKFRSSLHCILILEFKLFFSRRTFHEIGDIQRIKNRSI